MNSSPIKRRALAAVDPNVQSPNPKLASKAAGYLEADRVATPLKPSYTTSILPTPAASESRKRRSPSILDDQPVKKTRLDTGSNTGRESSPVAEHAVDNHVAMNQSLLPVQSERPRSTSPDAWSVFDHSVVDTSQATNVTEPDEGAAAIPNVAVSVLPPRRTLTREESRQKAEILKLRLGLANYKVRTNQVDLPFDRLQPRPLPGAIASQTAAAAAIPTTASLRASQPASQQLRRGPAVQGVVSLEEEDDNEEACDDDNDDDEDAGDSDEDVPIATSAPVINGLPASRGGSLMSPEKLPRLPPTTAAMTPRRRYLEEDTDENLTSSALRGGAANGLLSLSLARV